MEKEVIKKTCSFYVSEYHLVTMLLPYIKEKIEQKASIRTMLEENVEENIQKLISNLNLETECKNKILNINWKSFQVYKYPEIENELKLGKITNIIVSGKYEYVEMMNQNIERWIEKNRLKGSITINNCYDVTSLSKNVDEIINKHDSILNTSGEQDIQSIFEKSEKIV